MKGKTGVTSEEFKSNPIFDQIRNHGKEWGYCSKLKFPRETTGKSSSSTLGLQFKSEKKVKPLHQKHNTVAIIACHEQESF